MGRPSKIDRLPDEIKSAIGALRNRGCTIDEILTHLDKLAPDADISRSGLHRHVQKIDAIGEKIRESRAISEALVSKFGSDSENKTGRLNLEIMQSIIMQMIAAGGEEVTFDPKETLFLSDALNKLAAAANRDTDNILKIRKVALREAEEAVVEKAKKAGLSAETVTDLKSAFLGIKQQ